MVWRPKQLPEEILNLIAPRRIRSIERVITGLHVSTDYLVFEQNEREPDDDLKLMFEAIRGFDEEDKAMAHKVLQGLIIQSQAKRWSANA